MNEIQISSSTLENQAASHQTLFPLVSADQISRFLRIQKIYNELTEKKRQADSDKSLNQDLNSIRESMGRDRLRIGMIGPSQVGKSTTIANLLKVHESEGPTPTGGIGAACTSVATRVRPVAFGSKPSIQLKYLNEEQYRERITKVRDKLGIASSLDGESLIQECKKRLSEKITSSTLTDRFMIQLIQAAKAFPQLLQKGEAEEGDYEKRSIYLSRTDEISKYVLLREVIIDFPTNELSSELELIDLPGLGTAAYFDDIVTEQLLPELDGAFIFQSALKHLNDGSVVRLIDLLRKNHGRRLGERTWFVTAGFDSLTTKQLFGVDGKTIFDTLKDFMLNQNVKPHRAILTGNHVYQALVFDANQQNLTEFPQLNQRLVNRVINSGLKVDIDFQWDEEGQPVVPVLFKNHPELIPAYEAVMKNGGIGHFHEVINKDVVDSIKAEINLETKERLSRLSERLRNRIKMVQESGAMSIEDIVEAAEWSAAINGVVLKSLTTQPHIYEEKTEWLQTELKNYLDRVQSEDLRTDTVGQIHQRNCKTLSTKMMTCIKSCIDDIFSKSDALMKQVALTRNVLSTGSKEHRDPYKWWQEKITTTLQSVKDNPNDPVYTKFFKGFSQPELKLEGDSEFFPVADYKSIMNRKIDVIVFQSIGTILMLIINSLKEVSTALQTLQDVQGDEIQVDDQDFEILLQGI